VTTVEKAAGLIAAKFRHSADGQDTYHPLLCHLIDVAVVAEALWEECFAKRAREHLTESLQLDSISTKQWVAFLAGIHDLGKATPVFQAKGSRDRRSTPPWLVNTPLEFRPLSLGDKDPWHGTVTAACLPDILSRQLDVSQESADRLAVIAGGHHGVFPSATSRRNARIPTARGEPRRGEPNPWPSIRDELATTLASLLGLVGLESSPQLPSNAASMLLAGFISVADWIGSIDDSAFFPYAPDGPDDLPAYLADRKLRAHDAIRLLHWDAWPRQSKLPRFEELFPKMSPRPLQVATEQVAPEVVAPGLVILEAPMGEGKTEAAFYLADYWNASGFRGSYIAMPTQATSNQLHQRFERFLRGRYGTEEKINMQLLHGHAALNTEIKLLENGHAFPAPSGIDPGSGELEATVGAGEWFTYRKRGLLAPFGVGTVDQALLSVLQVKHGFVRLFGLAGKTVVVDEVHAYDAYMTTLLERLLEWLAALGSPVVLLSATLPTVRRQALVNAYLSGLGRLPVAELPNEAYPRITWTGVVGVRVRTVEAAVETRRRLGLRWLPFGIESLPAHLLGQLRDGGCAAVICNTVNRAQEVHCPSGRLCRPPGRGASKP